MLEPSDVDVFDALALNPDIEVSCTAHRGGTQIDVPLVVTGGGVSMSAGSGVRAVLDAGFAPAPGLRDALVPGVVLRPSWTIRWGAMGQVVCPFGEFVIEDKSVTYDRSSGGVQVTAPDFWVRVMRVRMSPETPTGLATDVAARWVRAGLRDHPLAGEVIGGSSARVGGTFYSGDRDRSIRDLLRSVGLQAHIDRARRLVIGARPDLTASPVWEVTPLGRAGTFDSATSTHSSSTVINSYTVYPRTPGRWAPFYVEDTDPRSPTYVRGPLGSLTAPEPFIAGDSPVIAKIAAEAELARTTSLAFTTSVRAAANPFLDPDDAGFLTLPAQGGDDWHSEKALISKVTHPLVPGELMSMDLRSRNPLLDMDAA